VSDRQTDRRTDGRTAAKKTLAIFASVGIYLFAINILATLPTDELRDIRVNCGGEGMRAATVDVYADGRVDGVDGDLLRRRTDMDLRQQVFGRRSAE